MRSTAAAALLPLPILLLVQGSSEAVETRVWRTYTDAAPVYFPERDDPESHVPWLFKNPAENGGGWRERMDRKSFGASGASGASGSFGVAFPSGGARAAAALGQIRALHKSGWMKKVTYISAISGGAWTAVPYSFLPETPLSGCSPEIIDMVDDDFLGKYRPPGELNNKKGDPNSINSANGAMSKAIAGPDPWAHLFRSILTLRGDETVLSDQCELVSVQAG